MRKGWLTLLLVVICTLSRAVSILIPMDGSQRNHLKAYGVVYSFLQKGTGIDWLLNYRGGSFLASYSILMESECKIHGVSFEIISDTKTQAVLGEIGKADFNMNVVRLEKAARIVVYSPKNDIIEDESDAVIAVLDYAEIPYKIVYDEFYIHSPSK